MIEAILPSDAFAAEEFSEGDDGGMFAEEAAAVAGAVPRRRREFAGVRRCARRALGMLGEPAAAILPGPGGAPVWPEGIVGSMTHCAGYRAAVVADRARLGTIGIDAEPNAPLPDDVLERVARADEVSRSPGTLHGVHWGRLLFSAKEAVYKAWYPLTGQWLDFTDVRVRFDPLTRTFRARVLVAGGTADYHGAWMAAGGLVLTACVGADGVRSGGGGAPRDWRELTGYHNPDEQDRRDDPS